MCELPWYPLAEVYLKNRDNSKEIYCLCSRAFLRNKDDSLKRSAFSAEFSASEEEPLIDEEVSSECSSLPQILKNKTKQEVEPESLSCYCSASHTDNHSTDEHDSLRDFQEPRPPHRGLQSSDSGADLTEYLRQDLEGDWQKFWSLNGEKLIWKSWIAKYSEYINPDYRQYVQCQASRQQLTLDVQGKNRILVRNLSGSDDKLNAEVSEGWNPLSPVSAECETDAEQLLSSKCGSLRTVDSMTNVTRMTISSLDLSQSDNGSESFSSVSSLQSSLSSTSSEENEDDFQHQWHILWKRHYYEEFARQHNIFVVSWKGQSSDVSKIDSGVPTTTKKSIAVVIPFKTDCERGIPENTIAINALSNLISNLKVSEEPSEYDSMDEEKTQMAALGLPTSFGVQAKRDSAEMDTKNSGDFESCRKRIKAAFNLMGVEYHDTKDKALSGQVHYKMRHIRLQNRHLKLRNERPKHTYFDDDGNVVSETVVPEDEKFHSVLPDSPEEKVSSADDEIAESVTQIEETAEEPLALKRKRRRRKIGIPPEIKENSHLRKFWHRRFKLFSKFDEGIKLDEESWYSVTPEQIARYTAERCSCDVIVDGFCGAGGNTIQFAMTCKQVIAIDIDPKKIELARHNAQIYGVADRIEFIVGDFFQLAPTLKADVVFFSPPWGGPSYLKTPVYDLETMLQPAPISTLLAAGRAITSNIAVFLPKNSNSFILIDEAQNEGGVEIEENFMEDVLMSITAYYNDLIKKI